MIVHRPPENASSSGSWPRDANAIVGLIGRVPCSPDAKLNEERKTDLSIEIAEAAHK